MQLKNALVLVAVHIMTLPGFSAECSHGSVRTVGVVKRATQPDTLTVSFEIELESDSFAHAKDAGDAFRKRLSSLQPDLPDGALMSVGYDFGVLSQKRLAWTKGKKLQYEFVVTVTAIPDGGALEALVAVVDGALALDAKLIVQRISASLSLEASQRVRSKLLEEAVANARANASIIAETSGLRLVGVSAVSMVGALPATSFGDNLDQDGLNILGRSYASILVLRKPFSIDAGIPDVELTGSVVATFCAEAM